MERSDRADLIYFEPQAAALCGVHALNALLQGPYFSEVELAQIAQELDELEHQLMLEAGVSSEEYQMFIQQESGNVADHGMFSIQVLAKALEVWGLSAININNPEASMAKADPTTQVAFILNLQEHWFTVRQIHGQWWNLNSIFLAPEPLSPFYLSAFLGSMQEQGYSVFVIRGQLPQGQHHDATTGEGPGRWFAPEEARAAHEEAQRLKQQGFAQAAVKGVLGKASAAGNVVRLTALKGMGRLVGKRPAQEDTGGDDPDLARALAASMAEHEQPSGSGGGSAWGRPRTGGAAGAGAHHNDEDADLAAAIAASLAEHSQQPQEQAGAGTSAAAAGAGLGGGGQEEWHDPTLEAAIRASLQQHAPPAEPAPASTQQEQQQEGAEPAAAGEAQPALPQLSDEPEAGSEGEIEVGLRLPDGARVTRRFLAAEHTLGHVAALAAARGVDMRQHRLAQRFPRRVFEDWGQALQEAGIGDKEMLNVEQS